MARGHSQAGGWSLSERDPNGKPKRNTARYSYANSDSDADFNTYRKRYNDTISFWNANRDPDRNTVPNPNADF